MGSVKLIFTKLINLFLLTQTQHKAMHMYGGGLLNTICSNETRLEHSQKRIMKPFAFTKPHDFRVFTKEYS